MRTNGSTEIKPELELTFLLAGTQRRRIETRQRSLTLLEIVDFDELAHELSSRMLLPLIGSRLLDLAQGGLPRSFVDKIESALFAARARAAGTEALAEYIVGTIESAGIAVLPLKGAYLARSAHGDPGLRIAGDIDLLVPAEDLDRAAELLQQEGYAEPARTGRQPELHYALAHSSLVPVELHWRVHWYEGAFSRDMLARSERGADGLLTPAPSDELATLLLYFARDGFHGLRLAADISGWSDRHLSGLAPGALDDVASHYPQLVRAIGTAAIVAERFTGVPRTALLSSVGPTDRRATMAGRLANWSGLGEPDQLRANVSLVDGLLAPPGGVWPFIRRQLLPPAYDVASFYRIPITATYRVAAGRLRHAAKLLARYTIALWRAREWVSASTAPGSR